MFDEHDRDLRFATNKFKITDNEKVIKTNFAEFDRWRWQLMSSEASLQAGFLVFCQFGRPILLQQPLRGPGSQTALGFLQEFLAHDHPSKFETGNGIIKAN